ncbi:MAG TPA: glycosyltransferase family 2 protein [Xanthobacteraceae bacterium]|nr:glycosyltransferase family 2 protein [Xanthobacteraceae bacterium]
MNRRLPFDYNIRRESTFFTASPLQGVSLQLCEFLLYLAERAPSRQIIDVGCGVVSNLKNRDHALEIICVGEPRLRGFVAMNAPHARFIEQDLEKGLPHIDIDPSSTPLVVCSNAIERLGRPEALLTDLAKLSQACGYMLITTPDRVRSRGLMDMGPPKNDTHTMEWTADELGRLMLDCGFRKNFFIGYSPSNDLGAKNAVLAVAGRNVTFSRPHEVKSVAAIIAIYNEEDIIEELVRYLKAQGVDVHIVDNWSTDHSWEKAQRLYAEGVCKGVVRFPAAPTSDFELANILRHTAEYAAKLESDWVMHYDADEFRCAPWPEATLAEAITFVDGLGCSAIDFTVLNFGFTGHEDQDRFSPNAFKFFDFARHPSHLLQVKAWKNDRRVLDLVATAGHVAVFPGSHVYPIKFLTRHYPLRSAKHAAKKLFKDRLPRVEREKRERGWHNHYDTYLGMTCVGPWRRYELLNFDLHMFNAEYLIERLSGVGIETEARAIPSVNTWFLRDDMNRTAIARLERTLGDLQAENDALKSKLAEDGKRQA